MKLSSAIPAMQFKNKKIFCLKNKHFPTFLPTPFSFQSGAWRLPGLNKDKKIEKYKGSHSNFKCPSVLEGLCWFTMIFFIFIYLIMLTIQRNVELILAKKAFQSTDHCESDMPPFSFLFFQLRVTWYYIIHPINSNC